MLNLVPYFLVDLVLVDLDVRLAQRAGRDDHVGAVVVGRLDDVLDQRLALLGLGEGQRAAAAGDLLLVLASASAPTVSTSLSRYFGFSNDSPAMPNGRLVWQPT
jgi:hypothetical protein